MRWLSYSMAKKMMRSTMGKKKKGGKGGMNVYYSKKNLQLSAYPFSRWCSNTSLDNLQLTTSEYDYARQFQISDVPAFNDFSDLFDEYKIVGVTAHIQLITNPDALYQFNQNAATNGNNSFPRLWYVEDFDDSTAIALSNIRQRADCKMIIVCPNKIFKVELHPRVSGVVNGLGGALNYGSRKNVWLDCTNSSTPHYGFKCVLELGGWSATSPGPIVKIEYQYHFMMRGVV